jgi:hypothetical protein
MRVLNPSIIQDADDAITRKATLICLAECLAEKITAILSMQLSH